MPRLPNSTASTRRGTARKNQVYAHATVEMIGFGDSRMTAMTMPSRTPRIIASTVSSRLVRTPSSTGGRNMLRNMNRHWNASFVTSMCANIATSTAMTASAAQRPGWRTGTARMGSGPPAATCWSVVRG